jgi:hypothetical protein
VKWCDGARELDPLTTRVVGCRRRVGLNQPGFQKLTSTKKKAISYKICDRITGQGRLIMVSLSWAFFVRWLAWGVRARPIDIFARGEFLTPYREHIIAPFEVKLRPSSERVYRDWKLLIVEHLVRGL